MKPPEIDNSSKANVRYKSENGEPGTKRLVAEGAEDFSEQLDTLRHEQETRQQAMRSRASGEA